MSIKIQNRDPKITDFSSGEFVINISEGTLFYKAKTNLYKIQGDQISTSLIESNLPGLFGSGSDMIVSGSIIPIGSGSFDLGSSTNPWKDLHIMTSSVKFYDTDGEVGRISYKRDEGIEILDDSDALSILSASLGTFTTRVKSMTGSFDYIQGVMNGGSF